MKPYLISTEVLARQVFRYHPAYRFAAFLLCAFLGAQVPFIVWIVYERELTAQRQERAAQLASDSQRIASDRKALAPTEKKLKHIQDLAPLLRARLPIGAVLGKIEQLTPPNLTVAKITVDAEAYHVWLVAGTTPSATFRAVCRAEPSRSAVRLGSSPEGIGTMLGALLE